MSINPANISQIYAKRNFQQSVQYFEGRIENIAYSHGLKQGGLNKKNDGAVSLDELKAAYNAKDGNTLTTTERRLAKHMMTYFKYMDRHDGSISHTDVLNVLQIPLLGGFLKMDLENLKKNI